MSTKLYVILVCYNQKDEIGECLSSLIKANHPARQIVVFDNNSTDGSAEMILERYPEVILLKNGQNIGFSEANNQAASLKTISASDYLLILNSDTIVPPTFFKRIQKADFYNSHTISGLKILYHNDPRKIWFAGGFFDIKHCNHKHRGLGEVDHGQYDDVVRCDFITGCALVIRKSLFTQLGGFDKKFFMYCEDMDLCLRAKGINAKVHYIGHAELFHKIKDINHKQTRLLTRYYYARNMLFTVKTVKRATNENCSYTVPVLHNILTHCKLFVIYAPLGIAGMIGIIHFIAAYAGRCPRYIEVFLNRLTRRPK